MGGIRSTHDSLPVKKITSTVDEAIRLTGVGLFHWLLVAVAGMCSASAVCEIVSASYLLSPAAWASCDLQMEAADMRLLSSIIFIGMIAGTHLWGVMADSWGRVTVLRLVLLGDAVVGAVSSLIPDKRIFIATRFINGFLIAGSASPAMAYLGEFHSESSRARAMLILAIFPGSASILVAALAYLVLPMQLAWQLPWIEVYRSWRLFVLLNSVPALLTGLALLWFPESPRYLLTKGCPDLALDALRKVYAVNKGRKNEFPVGALISPLDGNSPATATGNKLLAVWRKTVPLVSKQYLRTSLVTCSVMFTIIASANGLLVWMPEIFDRMATFVAMHPGQDATACDAMQGLQHATMNASLVGTTASDIETQPIPECGGELQNAMFIDTGAIGVANVVMGLLGAIVVDCLGKRNLLVGSLLVSALCSALMTVLHSTTTLLVLACGLISLTSTCISVVVSFTVESFPTELRATAVSLGMLAGRSGSMTGSLVFGTLLESQCSFAFWGLSTLLAVCGGLSLLLPRRGRYAA